MLTLDLFTPHSRNLGRREVRGRVDDANGRSARAGRREPPPPSSTFKYPQEIKSRKYEEVQSPSLTSPRELGETPSPLEPSTFPHTPNARKGSERKGGVRTEAGPPRDLGMCSCALMSSQIHRVPCCAR